jgi:hypothetical protein
VSGPISSSIAAAYKDALVGGPSTYTKRDWLVENTTTLQALEQVQTASAPRAPSAAFSVRYIENGYVLVHEGAEYFCDDFEKVAARVVAILAADAMDRTNQPSPVQDHAAAIMRYMLSAYPNMNQPYGHALHITGAT